jgi:4'-phosphopantetheinyl transferase EntD
LARQLFRSFGLPEAPILNREDRSPIWPQGYTGSITHTALWCGVAFAPLSAVRSVGIDAEAAERLDPKVAERVLTTREWQRISEAGHHPPEFAALWFSAKESVYKCVFPIVRRFIGFTEVEIHVSIADGTFRAEPVGAQLEAEHGVTVRQLRGRFLSTDALWLTSATLDS